MSEVPRAKFDAFCALMEPFYQRIGEVASGWSLVELFLDETIWCLADVDYESGACLTAQFQSVRTRIDCILALLKLRGASALLVGKVNEFAKMSGKLAQRRNRVVHDPVATDEELTRVIRSTIIAEKKLKLEQISAVLADYESVNEAIFYALQDLLNLQSAIFAELPSFDKRQSVRSHLQLHLLDRSNPANDAPAPTDPPSASLP